MYNNFIKNKTQEQINAFANNQTHIAAGFMMTTLANLKIDSCPIGGFIEEEILKILEKNPNNYGVSMLLPIGYRLKNGREKTRRNFNEIVEIRE